MTQYAIVDNTNTQYPGYTGYGASKDIWRCKSHEIIVHGPYETGKTLGNLQKLHMFLCKYPNARGLMLRKTYKSLCASGVVTYERDVLPFPPGHPKCPVNRYGGEKPQWYDYPNRARLEVGGLDNIHAVLSAEYDIICVIQAEELTEDEWQALTTRCTGRAGNAPYAQIIGDCNPGPDTHWILHRNSIQLFKSTHRDNPTLYHPDTGELTEQGKRTMEVLNNLTGVARKRGRDGLWVAAEGQVYEFDASIHMVYEHQVNMDAFTRFIAGVDWGFTNPGVISIWAIDGDGRMCRVKETYRTKERISYWVEVGKKYRDEYGIEAFVCDPSEPAYIADFKEAGLNAVPANNAIEPRINAVNERLAVQPDGKPRLTLVYDVNDDIDQSLAEIKNPTCTEQEFPRYIWPQGKETRNADERPVKKFDHGMDAMGYIAMYLHESISLTGFGTEVGTVKGWF